MKLEAPWVSRAKVIILVSSFLYLLDSVFFLVQTAIEITIEVITCDDPIYFLDHFVHVGSTFIKLMICGNKSIILPRGDM